MSFEASGAYVMSHSVMVSITDLKTGESMIPLDTPDVVRHVASGKLGIVFSVYPGETFWWFTYRLQKHIQMTWEGSHRSDITDAKDVCCYLRGLPTETATQTVSIREYGTVPLYLTGLRTIEVVVEW